MHLDTVSAIAVAAVSVAALALLVSIAVWRALHRVSARQLVILGGGKRDLLEFAVSLQGRIDDVYRAVDEIASGLTRVDKRIDRSISNVAIVRYDAYEDRGGQQSTTFALLDASRTGIVVSAIQGRDYARIYMKELDRGNCSVVLSPEEEETIRRAMAR